MKEEPLPNDAQTAAARADAADMDVTVLDARAPRPARTNTVVMKFGGRR
ncbi:MAG: hypothetical protein M5U22_16755 [Thermoleophilia bacterium]|nr:hypothetical protein [Thermoleophilia bacterium]